MCLIALAWKVNAEYPLVVCANRDEYYARPTEPAHFWEDSPQIFAGRDLQGGGSWMGVSRTGRFAAVTNIRNPATQRDDAQSRGLLVSEFLGGEQNAPDYCQQLQSEAQHYNGYNMLVLAGDNLVYQSNRMSDPKILSPGFYAISNATIDTPWPKTHSALDKLTQWLLAPDSVHSLASLLNDNTRAEDDRLPQTGVSLELERALSAEFIRLEGYGTRCSSGLLVHASGTADFCEITHDAESSTVQQRFDDF